MGAAKRNKDEEWFSSGVSLHSWTRSDCEESVTSLTRCCSLAGDLND